MITLKEEDYTINICIDIIEWAKKFYDMPDDAILENKSEVDNECMGFACIEDKEVWIFIPKEYKLKELKETIAHEIGHIIELKYPTNPPTLTDKNEYLHELKADHYMSFYSLVDKIVTDVVSVLIES
jgi:hypothetical protein